MSRADFELLTHAVLDGTATPAERGQLDAMVASDSQLRERWELQQVAFRALAEVEVVAPPPDLAPGVMRRIREQKLAANTRRGASLKGLWILSSPLRIGIAAAAACAVVVLVWVVLQGRDATLGSQPVSGTMMPDLAAGARGTIVRVGATAVRLEVVQVANGVEILVERHGPGDAELVLEHDPALVSGGIREIQSQPRHVSYGPGRVALELSSDARLAVRLQGVNAEARPIRVTVRSSEGTAEGVLRGR